jgi:membrane associated rhomboid family serine protease
MFPPGVKWLLIANAAAFVVYFLGFDTWLGGLLNYFKLFPQMVIGSLAVWQLVTYLFLHAGLGHLFFNMIGLWMFGAELERTWGTRKFLQFYFLCGVGAGVFVVLADLLSGAPNIPTIGASGAIFGVLLAYGLLFPDNLIWVWFLFPVKAKWFVLALGAINFLYLIKAPGSGVSHVAHLGGMLIGYLYLKSKFTQVDLLNELSAYYRDWKLKRARRKFNVYMKKQNPDDDRWHKHRRDDDRDPWVH